eukprot:353950-Chlamydomonas_euryale.AAC.5
MAPFTRNIGMTDYSGAGKSNGGSGDVSLPPMSPSRGAAAFASWLLCCVCSTLNAALAQHVTASLTGCPDGKSCSKRNSRGPLYGLGTVTVFCQVISMPFGGLDTV